ncbi:Imm70 family immunity protein [Planctomyces sp. SH-PL14]|uniref:Imm70 family immunity protein n=1 Tax=Planctomyces sp. SH-PL14 TaxID=1632864 RepID=UPI00078D8759|nr:hypothetical protein VT03_10760 [Planctomyces sp. SH-PL14]
MGLYLCVFDDGDELEGVEVGSYADFGFFRDSVTELLEGGKTGDKYPTLILHSDCDGEWTLAECERLKGELEDISAKFRDLPAIQYQSDWQRHVAHFLGLKPTCLYDSFIDVDGEPVLERLSRLCSVAIQSGQSIVFQ